MSEPDTSATSQDPSLPSEGDSDQLPKEDTLESRGVDDLLDEWHSPPDRDPLKHKNLTPAEQAEGDSLDERLDREEPEVWEQEQQPPAHREPGRAGRLESADSDGLTEVPGETQSVMAEDVGVAGGAATAEEAAMHERDEDDTPGLTDVVGNPSSPD